MFAASRAPAAYIPIVDRVADDSIATIITMKLKRQAEDFQVDEQISLVGDGGPFALYRLTKHSIGTPEAIDAIARRWDLAPHAIAFAGLKDKHALTRQFVTIHHGPKRAICQTNLEVDYIG